MINRLDIRFRAGWRVVAGLSLLTVLTTLAPAQDLQFASLGDFRLESGATIRGCRLGYRTLGHLNQQRSNAVLFPTWFSGKTEQLVGLVGPGKLVDTSKYFVVLIDALGNGVSSSPSNSEFQPGPKFPKITIRDMVDSEYRLAKDVLKLEHVLAVIGISMGGMQTFEWMVAHPEYMSKAVPIVGTPSQTSYDLLLWRSEADAIRLDPAWQNGEYKSQPEKGLGLAGAIHELALSTPSHRIRTVGRGGFEEALAKTKKGMLGNDANDWLAQLEAMMAQDVAHGGTLADAAGKVRAKVLVVVGSQDHMVNPTPALEFARALNAPTLALTGDCGHLSTGCEADTLYASVGKFLDAAQ